MIREISSPSVGNTPPHNMGVETNKISTSFNEVLLESDVTNMNPKSGSTWIDTFGNKVIVRDCVSSGDNANAPQLVITNNGELELREFLSAYTKISDTPIINMQQQTSKAQENINCGIEADSLESLMTKQSAIGPIQQQSKQQSLVEKLFNKLESKENIINIDIQIGNNFPNKQLQMLKEYFDVTDDDIIEYVINDLIDKTLLYNSLKIKLQQNFAN